MNKMDKAKKDERLPMWADSWTKFAAKVPLIASMKAKEAGGIENHDGKIHGINITEIKAKAFDEIFETLQSVDKKKAIHELFVCRFMLSYDPDSAISAIHKAISPFLDE